MDRPAILGHVARPALLPTAALLAIVAIAAGTAPGMAQAPDTQDRLPLAAHGTRFTFEIIESHDAKYLGDTPGHTGRDGGLEVRPNVALDDLVYRDGDEGAPVVVGRITAIVWERVSGSLTVEFDPQPLMRIAVGDEVWIDLNPKPAAACGNRPAVEEDGAR